MGQGCEYYMCEDYRFMFKLQHNILCYMLDFHRNKWYDITRIWKKERR